MGGLEAALLLQPSDTLSNRDTRVFKCVNMPVARQYVTKTWFRRWYKMFSHQSLWMNTVHQEALARLVPTLLCGEQSAVAVFHAEAERLSTKANNVSFSIFQTIEADECLHEAGLQVLCDKLPVVADLHAIKRRSQRFFLKLGQAKSVAQHFSQIAQLDSAVCLLMWHIENSAVGCNPMIGSLTAQIKKDEARHVSISRRHALALGVSRNEYQALGEQVFCGLTKLLAPVADSFETIGVDSDRLFARLQQRCLQ
jgi:hypothetical protein